MARVPILLDWSIGSVTREGEGLDARLLQAFKLYLDSGVHQSMPNRELADPPAAYYCRNLPRLTRIKAKYDPKNLFRFEQSIPVGDSQ